MFKLTTGEELLKEVVITATLNKSIVRRSFCSRCGSPLTLQTTNPKAVGEIGVTAGTIDFDKQLDPADNLSIGWQADAELFVEDRFLCLAPMEGVEQCNYRERSLAALARQSS